MFENLVAVEKRRLELPASNANSAADSSSSSARSVSSDSDLGLDLVPVAQPLSKQKEPAGNVDQEMSDEFREATIAETPTSQEADEIVNREDLVPEQQARILELETQLKSKEDLALKHRARLFDLQGQISRLTTENEELLRCKDVASRPGSQLLALQYEVSTLRRERASWLQRQQDVSRIPSNRPGVFADEISTGTQYLEECISRACYSLPGFEAIIHNAVLIPENTASLEQISIRLFGVGIAEVTQMNVGALVDKHSITQSYAAAFICINALETSFPDMLHVGSPLLRGYREHVLAQDGPEALRTLDLIAHKSLVSEPYFTSKVIPGESRELAIKFSALVSAVTLSSSSRAKDKGPDPWGMFIDMPVEDMFKPIFEQALQLKMKLLLTGHRYRLQFCRHGTVFNPTTMKKHDWRFGAWNSQMGSQPYSPTRAPHRERRKVKICLFPAIWAWLEPRQDTPINPMVDYRQFVVDYEICQTVGASFEGYELIEPAVVLL
ncbi:hypothetical protein F4778DRAFT_732355 [Xylariomycetidae sp. FL2044]|nr:hypothetical protein F4778DRAFT_732355 [Xylariomycetidae sp. FL2044]